MESKSFIQRSSLTFKDEGTWIKSTFFVHNVPDPIHAEPLGYAKELLPSFPNLEHVVVGSTEWLKGVSTLQQHRT